MKWNKAQENEVYLYVGVCICNVFSILSNVCLTSFPQWKSDDILRFLVASKNALFCWRISTTARKVKDISYVRGFEFPE